MNNNLEFENTDPSPNSIEDNHPRTNYGEGYYEEPKQETLEEASLREYPLNYHTGEHNPNNVGRREIFSKGAKWQEEQDKNKYSEEDMIFFAEFVATYSDKNKNVHGQMLHAKSKYDGAERTIDLFKIWFEQNKNK